MKLYVMILFCFGLLFCATGLCNIQHVEFPKADYPAIGLYDRWDLLVLKFRDNTDIRFRDGRLTAPDYIDLSPVHKLLDQYPETHIDRLFSRPEAVYDYERLQGEQRSGRQLADLNLYYVFRPTSREQALTLLEALNRMDLIECAYAEPTIVPLNEWNPANSSFEFPNLPPDFTGLQDYMDQAPVGVNAAAAWAVEGGRGENSRLVDFDGGWIPDHIDLPEPLAIYGEPYTSGDLASHGTAVIGEICSFDNGFGTTGIAPDSTYSGVTFGIPGGNTAANVIDLAFSLMDTGDFLLVLWGSIGVSGESLVLEYEQAVFDLIANNVAQGKICIEAAGNGGVNLDDPIYEGRFDRSVRDSGAIMVGAGTPYEMQPETWSSYGSRIDVNGWGSEIVSCGFGDLFGSDYTEYYTAEFGGTCGAAAMVAGACLCVQSIYKEISYGTPLDPLTLRAVITDTGYPQPEPIERQIGPRPDLEAIIQHDILQNIRLVRTDKPSCMCNDDFALEVVDYSQTGSVTVHVFSGTEPTGETLILPEVNAGLFSHSLTTSDLPPDPSDGIVSVIHGDTLQCEYELPDLICQVIVDCIPPNLQNLAVTEMTDHSATVSWQTDELSDSRLYYGESSPTEHSILQPYLTTEHILRLESLESNTDYLFYVESRDAAGNPVIDDNVGNYHTFTTWIPVTVYTEFMDTNPGWTISGGLWQFGVPEGLGGEYGHPDPVSGYTGENVFGYNLAGDYDNRIQHNLTTFPLNISGVNELKLRYWRWLGVEVPIKDKASIYISTDGVEWDLLWQNKEEVTDSAWIEMEHDLTPWAVANGFIQLRWIMGPTNDSKIYCGWNIDDVEISGVAPNGYASPTPMPTYTPTPTLTDTPTPTLTPTTTPLTTGVTITMPAHWFAPDDPCNCTVTVANAEMETLSGYPVFLVLDVFGAYYYAPGFTSEFDYYPGPWPAGVTSIESIPGFFWPDTGSTASGLVWYSALTDPDVSTIVGSWDSWEFGWE